MDLEHPAPLAHDPRRLEQADIVEPEVEDHERLARRHAGVDDRRQLGDRVVHPAADGEAHAVVDRAVRFGRRSPLAETGQERALGLRRRPGSRVVEREERGRATKGCGYRILEEPVGLGIVATRVWVWTSTAPGGPAARSRRRVGRARRSRRAAVRSARATRRRDDGPPDQKAVTGVRVSRRHHHHHRRRLHRRRRTHHCRHRDRHRDRDHRPSHGHAWP